MTTPRKKWSTTTLPYARISHPSQAAAYRYVQARAVDFHAGGLRPDITTVTVWVDEGLGRGWERFEVVALADLPAAT